MTLSVVVSSSPDTLQYSIADVNVQKLTSSPSLQLQTLFVPWPTLIPRRLKKTDRSKSRRRRRVMS